MHRFHYTNGKNGLALEVRPRLAASERKGEGRFFLSLVVCLALVDELGQSDPQGLQDGASLK